MKFGFFWNDEQIAHSIIWLARHVRCVCVIVLQFSICSSPDHFGFCTIWNEENRQIESCRSKCEIITTTNECEQLKEENIRRLRAEMKWNETKHTQKNSTQWKKPKITGKNPPNGAHTYPELSRLKENMCERIQRWLTPKPNLNGRIFLS